MDNFRINAQNNRPPPQNNPHLDHQNPDPPPVFLQDVERWESMAVAVAILVSGAQAGIGLIYLHRGDTANAYECFSNAAMYGIGGAVLFWAAVNRR